MATPHITGLGLCIYAQFPTKFPSALKLTEYITFLAGKNSKVAPPLPQGTTSLIGFNGI